MRFDRSAFLGGLAGAAALTLAPGAARAASRGLTIAYVPSTLFAPVFVAAERGFLAAEGWGANLTPVVAGQDAVALLAQGQIDVAASAVSAAFYNAVERGLDVKFVGSTAYQPRRGHPSALMIREDLYASGEREPRSLKGKKIGWTGGGGAVSAYYVARILRSAGLTLRDVEPVNIANPDQGVALERKAIDAVFTSAPFTKEFEERKLARIIAGPPAGISGSGILFGANLLKGPADNARSVLRALRRAAREVSKSYYRAENISAYARYTRQPAETLRHTDQYDFERNLRIDESTIEDIQNEFLRLGVLAYRNPLDIARLTAKF